MDTPPISALLDFALDAAWQAGRITLGYFQNGVTAERKSDNPPVTIADKTAEKRLRELIQKYWPDHGIIGEAAPHEIGLLAIARAQISPFERLDRPDILDRLQPGFHSHISHPILSFHRARSLYNLCPCVPAII